VSASQTPTLGGDATLLPEGTDASEDPAPAGPARSVAGLLLGRYRLERTLGQGAYGVVFLAHDPDLERKVALKVLRPRAHASDDARERFFREARVLASLLDPSIATVFDVGSAPMAGVLGLGAGDDEVFYIVMEYVAGTDLSTWLAAKRRSWQEVVRVFVRAGRGLAAAHRADVVHRDFKPSNVLMSTEGAVKVADFGLAQGLGSVPTSSSGPAESAWSDGSAEIDLTRTGTLLGTPMFMAPEQHEGGRVGPAADQFAFCVALYFGLTGSYPFEPGPHAALWAQKSEQAIAAWPAERSVPRWVRAVVERGLRADPDARFGAMEALLQRLEKSPARRAAGASTWILAPMVLAGGAWMGYQATRPATVSVELRSSAQDPLEDVRVQVDGATTRFRDGTLSLSSGQHLIEVQARDHDPVTRAVEVESGGDVQLAIELPRQTGVLDITAHPDAARIFVDGIDHGSRVRALALPTGIHEVHTRLDGHFTHSMQWTVAHGGQHKAVVSLPAIGVWEYASAPPNQDVTWLPDATGDGRAELLVARAGVATVVDPWNDDSVGSVRFAHSFVPEQRVADVDGDAMPEFISVAATEDMRTLAVHDLRTFGEPRWSRTFPGFADVKGTLVLIGPLLVVLDGDRVLALDAATGAQRWTVSMPGVRRVRALGGGALLLDTKTESVVLNTEGRERWRTPQTHTFAASDVDGDGDAEVLVLAEESVQLLDGQSGEPHWSIGRPKGDVSVIESAPASMFVLKTGDGVATYEATSGNVLQSFTGTRPQLHALGGRHLISTVEGESVVLRDLNTAAEIGRRPKSDARLRASGDFNGDGADELLWVASNGTMRFLDEALRPLAELELSKPATRLIDVRDANGDGVVDLLFENRRGLLLLEGPKRKWTVRSQHSVRAPVLLSKTSDDPTVLATVEREGKRHLARIDGRSGHAQLFPLEVGSDLHREAALHDDVLYFASRGGIDGYRTTDGAHVGQQRFGKLVYATPTVIDVDADGMPEVLAATFGGKDSVLAVLSSDLSEVEREVPIPEHVWARPLPLDIDGSSLVLVFGLQGGVAALDPANDWAPRWQTSTGARINFAGVPFETDAGTRIAVTTMARSADDDALIFLDAATGEIVERHPGWGSRTAPATVVDDALFVADNHGKLRRFERGALAWERTVTHASASGPLGVGKLRTDGPTVLATVWRTGSLVVVDASDGDALWRFSVDSRIEGRPLIADLEGDGESEVVIGTHDGTVLSLRSGPPTWSELRGE